MRKQITRLAESELVRIVKKMISESSFDNTELVYSTNPHLKTKMSEFSKFMKKGMNELPYILKDTYNSIFKAYDEDSEENDEYFRRYPNGAEAWYEQLKREFEETAERNIRWWVANSAFGGGRVYYADDNPEYKRLCDALCEKLLPYKWQKYVDKSNVHNIDESIRRSIRRYLR